MDIDHDSLDFLSAVVRTGSFDAASKSLGVTQSAVSQRIKQMEERAGSLLIVRGRPCVPTEIGLLLCQYSDQIAILRHDLEHQISDQIDGQETGRLTLRIGVNNDSLATWFPGVLARAQDELRIRLEILSDDQDYTEEQLRSGEALAVVTTSNKEIAGCHLVSLGNMEYLAVATPEFLGDQPNDDAIAEKLEHSTAIFFDQKDSLPIQWMHAAFNRELEVPAHYIPSYEGHLQSCMKSIGWVMMPRATVGPMLESGQLIEIVPDATVQMPLFWQVRNQSSTVLRRLTDIVAEEASEHMND